MFSNFCHVLKSIIIFSLLAAYALCGCSSNDSGNEPGPPPVDVRHVTVNSDNTTSDGSIFEPVDGTSFKIDHILYSIVGTHIEIAGGDSLKMGESIEPYASITYQSRNYKVRAVKEKAFYQFHHLKGVTLPEGIQYIGSDAFYNCIRLYELNLPSTLTRIGGWMCYSCVALKSITLPDNLETITYRAFYKCSNLKEVNFPSNLKEIGDGAFCGCISLTELNLPQSIVTVSPITNDYYGVKGAFQDCTSLSKVTLPANVQAVGDRAFVDCPSLKEVTCLAPEPPAMRYTTFENKDPETILYVLPESVESYKEAYYSDPENPFKTTVNVEIKPIKK